MKIVSIQNIRINADLYRVIHINIDLYRYHDVCLSDLSYNTNYDTVGKLYWSIALIANSKIHDRCIQYLTGIFYRTGVRFFNKWNTNVCQQWFPLLFFIPLLLIRQSGHCLTFTRIPASSIYEALGPIAPNFLSQY